MIMRMNIGISESVSNPCAIVLLPGSSRAARSSSTWIHCSSPVASANVLMLRNLDPVALSDLGADGGFQLLEVLKYSHRTSSRFQPGAIRHLDPPTAAHCFTTTGKPLTCIKPAPRPPCFPGLIFEYRIFKHTGRDAHADASH
jgi:hypothetical protein